MIQFVISSALGPCSDREFTGEFEENALCPIEIGTRGVACFRNDLSSSPANASIRWALTGFTHLILDIRRDPVQCIWISAISHLPERALIALLGSGIALPTTENHIIRLADLVEMPFETEFDPASQFRLHASSAPINPGTSDIIYPGMCGSI
ncbi:hypothetical protein [Haloglomus litoreum]|uniref:hypothetical protein n=1 Tax=Haloglomus litoreum TaxID=3034026 RepID=UPI0023E76658|nr:hypothetical protein [Haloglomus sp. DT116]